MKLNRVWVGVSLLATLAATAACGGDDNEGGGAAGSSTAGSASQAGAGGSGTAGSASQAGTATGVGGSVGTAGSSATAGTTGTGGSAANGDCMALCAKATIKACMGEDCVDNCTLSRQLFLGFFPGCSTQWDTLSACVAKQPNENVMCDGDTVSSPACATEQAALDACGS